MARTTALLVRGVLRDNTAGGGDYDAAHMPPLTRYITAANLLTTRVATCATNRGFTLSDSELQEIETWLAAWFYTRSDPIYASKSTGGASGSFVSDPEGPDRYKAGAVAIDVSGCLRALLAGARAGAFWNGRPPSEQTDYADRD